MTRRAALPPGAVRRQRGATLISLMVGLVVSMLVTVATLMLYKNLVRATGDSRVNAQFDAQRSAVLLMSGMTLQDAGFGIDDPQVGEHLITLKGTTLGNAGALQGTAHDCAARGDGCNAILWVQNTPKPTPPHDPVQTCSALLSDKDKGGLVKLTAWSGSGPLEGCSLSNWASLTWRPEPLAGAVELRVAFVRQEVSCSPFGISAGAASQALRVMLYASNMNEEVGNNVELESAHCLSNFSAPSSPPATPS